jgi:hypothetical protein
MLQVFPNHQRREWAVVEEARESSPAHSRIDRSNGLQNDLKNLTLRPVWLVVMASPYRQLTLSVDGAWSGQGDE